MNIVKVADGVGWNGGFGDNVHAVAIVHLADEGWNRRR